MSNIPLTEQQLNDIETRAQAATAGPWCTDAWEIYQGTEYEPGLSMWIGETCRGGTSVDQDRADAAFVAAARTDVPALVAEVRRLQQQRRFLIGQLAKRDAASGEADRKVREFLAGETAGSLDEAQPVPLRWGLDDVMWGDDDTTTVMLSGPDGEPYWLELDPERTAALRECLAGPDAAEETHVVADDSDDPEHVDDCPGCAATPAP